MARGFPPAIEDLARKRQLGMPEQLYTPLGLVVFLWGLLVILVLLDLFGALAFLVSLFTTQGHINPWSTLVLVVLGLGVTYLCFYGIRHVRSRHPYYCRCTEGFLELSPGDPPKVIHALRWEDVTSTRRPGPHAGDYSIRTRHGKDIRIRDSGLWDYCNEQVYNRTGNLS
jgi:hypothetical protein